MQTIFCKMDINKFTTVEELEKYAMESGLENDVGVMLKKLELLADELNTTMCYNCYANFPSIRELDNHKKMCKDLKKFDCFLCDKKFKSHKQLRQHMRRVMCVGPQKDSGKQCKQLQKDDGKQCERCNKIFSTVKGKKRHMKEVACGQRGDHSINDVQLSCNKLQKNDGKQCERCNKVFGTDKAKKRHMKEVACGQRGDHLKKVKSGIYMSKNIRIEIINFVIGVVMLCSKFDLEPFCC